METRAYYRLRTAGIVLLLLSGTMIWTGCKKKPKPSAPPPPSSGGQASPSKPLSSDLVISKITVIPAEPKAQTPFTVRVFVQNAGQKPSGQYDLAMFILDVSRNSTYPIGTFRQSGLQPGEVVRAYSSTDRLVNYPGAHQVWAEIKPFNFEDGNNRNNKEGLGFTVK